MKIDWKQFLQQHPIFSTVHDEQRIDALLRVSKEHAYFKDRNIVRQGEKGNSLFVIGSGSADALLEVRGEETIQLATIEKGEVFGEMAFFEQGRRAATVRAKELCTVLETPGPEIKNLVKDYPDIGFRLLLLMGERLRQTNERILALHLKTVDEKLDLFNKRLETDQRVAEAELKAAQAMFDQTKLRTDESLRAAQTVFDQIRLRTDEVISSAERSRDRLNKSALIVGSFVTVLVTILGVLGLKEVLSMDKLVEEVKKDAKDVAAIKKNAEDSMKGVQALQTELKNSKIGIYRTRFFDALNRGSPGDALDAYKQIKDADGLDGELNTLLGWMQQDVVVRAKLPPKNDEGQESNAKNFLELCERVENDAKRTRDKLDAFYLRLVYEYINGRVNFEDARGKLENYVKSTAKEAPLGTAALELVEWIEGEPGKRGEDLRKLSNLARISLKRPKP